MQKILNIRNVDNSNFEELCQAYKRLVSYWNSIINIVSTRNVDNLLTVLIQQSVKPLEFIDLPPAAKVLDVGSGAGFPGLPLKFSRQDLQLTLLEPHRKKMLFLKRAVEELRLENVSVVRERIETFAVRKDYQTFFDVITTRGTGSSLDFFPLFVPLLRPGGMCWFFKGKSALQEVEKLKSQTSYPVKTYNLDKSLHLIVIQVGV